MKKNEQPQQGAQSACSMSRRTFLKAGATGLGSLALMGNFYPVTAAAESPEEAAAQAAARVTAELPASPVAAPAKTEFDCDVLVIGGGFAGLNAAVAAKEAGQNVVLIDKGRPGYSGLTPWASSHRWFDAEMGDDEQAFKDTINRGGDYINNMNWYQCWIDESKETAQRLMDWGILTQYTRASEAGDYYDKQDYAGYREAFAKNDRRTKFIEVLNAKGIEYAENVMITNIVKTGDRVTGAVGFHVPSGAIVTCTARSIVMAMGGGAYKPSGFPVGGVTFDGEYIAYNLGLPIAGKEFDDFHMTLSYAPGNAFLNNNWTYLENIWLCGGDITAESGKGYADGKGKAMVLDRVTKAVSGLALNDGTAVEDMSTQGIGRRGGSLSENPADIRSGKMNDTMPKGDIYGAAVGFGGHLSAGVLCDLDDLDGFTGIKGLYVAGDGINAAAPAGAGYPCGVGFTSSFVSIQGTHAGKAAAAYAATAEPGVISADDLAAITEEINAPLSVAQGFDPNWARDQLSGIMSPYWIHIVKTRETLEGALAQVEYMRDNVVPKLAAATPHDLRLCHEMKHKVLSAEMKLRAGLAREETRGLSYRADFPYRDDENFLCYITVQKDEDGKMVTGKVPVKDEWKGDVTQPYAERYGYYFPGETEAKGIVVEESTGWGK